MRTRRAVALLFAACLVLVASAQVEDVPDAKRGHEVVQTLMTKLGGTLKSALQAGDTQAGFAACASMAQPLTMSVSSQFPDVLSLKRTSLQIRQPANQPTYEERRVLEELKASREASLTRYVQQNGTTVVAHYEPIRIQPLCLKCHGTPEQLAPGVRSLLDTRYPDDQAIGYTNGAFRGMIAVYLESPDGFRSDPSK